MTTVKKTATNTEHIIDYLLQHRDFFIHHQELLNRLEIPHQTQPEVSSLIEFQVRKLQRENEALKKSTSLMQQASYDKNKLIKKMFDLLLALCQVEDLDRIFEIFTGRLRQDYSADHVLILIFNKSKIQNRNRYIQYINQDSKIRFMFTELFNRNKPLCDSLPAEYLQILFGRDANQVRSTVILPINNCDWQSLIVLGSRSRNIYSYGIEIELLENVSKFLIHKTIV